MQVLIVESHATAVASNFTNAIYRDTWEFFNRLGATITERFYDEMTAADNATAWDLVVFPWIRGNGSVTTHYQQLETVLTNITTNPPACCLHADAFAANGTIQAITGCTAADTSSSQRVCDTVSWNGRTIDRLTFYGEAATTLSGATAHFTDSTGDICVWSNTVGGCAMLWIGGYNTNITDSTSKMWKPWLGAQWAVDNGSATPPRKAACLLFWDFLDTDLAIADYASGSGALDAIYNKAVSTGFPEIHVAAVGQGGNEPFANANDTADALENWFVARDYTNGTNGTGQADRLFRFHNHHTDIVDGASTQCTTDGVNLDQPDTATTAYETSCDAITGAGATCGDDGYGGGLPNVQNGNDAVYPSFKWLAQRGSSIYAGLQLDDDYPQAAGHTVTADFNAGALPLEVMGTKCLVRDAIDNVAETAVALTFNEKFLQICKAAGGLYIHAGNGNMNDFGYTGTDETADDGFYPEFFANFVAAPDILAGDWATLKDYIDSVTGSAAAADHYLNGLPRNASGAIITVTGS